MTPSVTADRSLLSLPPSSQLSGRERQAFQERASPLLSCAGVLALPRPFFRNGHLAVLAISSPSEMPRIEEAVHKLEGNGLRVTLAWNIASYGEHGYLAGTDTLRTETFNQFLRSEAYDAYIFARGGYGAMRILDRLDYAAIAANPRPIVGFSDLTALHQAIAVRCNLVSFHGPMINLDFFNGLSPEIERWFWGLLAGEAPLEHSFSAEQVVLPGEAEGTLFGGCLSITTSLIGTPYDFWIDDGIWFWEDVDEPVYRLDRMLTHLRLSGRFRGIRGVVVGKLKGCGEAAEIDLLLREFFGSLAIPVVRDIPFGHHGDNLLMPVGARVRLSTGASSLTVLDPVVAVRGSAE